MARNIQVSFGLLSFAGKADKATITRESMSNLCPGQPGKESHDPSPLKQPKVCEKCGPITDHEVLLKGIKRGSTYALVTQDDVAEAKEEYVKEYLEQISLVAHPAGDFLAQTAPGESVNYITPADAAGANIYQSLAKLIAAHPELAFVGLHTPRSSTSLFQFTVRDGILVMEQRTRSQSLKPAPSVGGEVNEKLYGLLDATLEISTEPYDPEAYEDKYAAAVERMASEADVVSIGTTAEAPVTGVLVEADLIAKLEKLSSLSAAS
jgi:non-homologous end joining protein Ku